MSQDQIDLIDGLLYKADEHIENGEFYEARDVASELYDLGCHSYANDIYCDVELAEAEAKADYEANMAYDGWRDNQLVA